MNVENMIRKNSLIYHYGIGGLWTNNSDETFIIRSPKFWNWDSETGECGTINEEHLRELLKINKILFPPGAKDKQVPFINGTISIGRFPGWHRCKGWRTLEGGAKEQCGAMCKLEQTDKLPLCTITNCSGSTIRDKSTLAPIRFMLICSNGHLDDFPFNSWVHKGLLKEKHNLRYINRLGSGLSGIFIQCETCSSKLQKIERSMQGALSPDSFIELVKCSGRTPWLNDISSICDPLKSEDGYVLVGVQKSSSNLLFPIVKNAIFCPSYNTLPSWIKNLIDKDTNRQIIKNLLPTFQTYSKPLEEILKILFVTLTDDRKLTLLASLKEIEDYLFPKEVNDPFKKNGYHGILQREYDRFINFPEEQKLDDFTIVRPSINEYSGKIKDSLSQVVLIEKLRDTRVYIGFTRVEPPSTRVNDNELIQQCYGANEVIGDIIRGEGLFLQFNEKELIKWSKSNLVNNRLDRLDKNRLDNLQAFEYVKDKGNASIFMLLHSISHALIQQISNYAGYNTSSIRERIYTGNDGKKGHMFGILIYTSDGDSEGSLGGLVRLGKFGIFEEIFESAVRSSIWCSSDPLCSSSIPKGKKGGVLAACHHCLLLPETSCQMQNEYLDRELIISLNDSKLGFFKL